MNKENIKYFYKHWWFWCLIVLIALIIIIAFVCLKNFNKNKISNNEYSSTEQQTQLNTEADPELKYYFTTTDDMLRYLDGSLEVAKDIYENKYVQITGKISNINGNDYSVTMAPVAYTYYTTPIILTVESIEQIKQLETLPRDSMVTLQGYCTSVDEVSGYHLNFIAIKE